MKEKRYEILDALPTYGPMYIPIPSPFYSQGFVIRFYKEDKSEWVANFLPGGSGFNCVCEFSNSKNILVIAGGACYMMNPEETKPISIFGGDCRGLLNSS